VVVVVVVMVLVVVVVVVVKKEKDDEDEEARLIVLQAQFLHALKLHLQLLVFLRQRHAAVHSHRARESADVPGRHESVLV
jgi:hypothetical protein